jgi:hypothetical protein
MARRDILSWWYRIVHVLEAGGSSPFRRTLHSLAEAAGCVSGGTGTDDCRLYKIQE